MVMLQASDNLPVAMDCLLPAVGGVPRNLISLLTAAARTCYDPNTSSDSETNALDVAALARWLNLDDGALEQHR